MKATPDGHPNVAGQLNNLGSCLSSRYERTVNLQDLEAAINHTQTAVDATPEDHPDHSMWLNNLSIHLGS